MSKRLYTYAGFTAQDLKNRASIPSQADITVGSNYIDCSSVDIPSEIRDVIGEGSNDLGTIYLSAKVNKWSGFGPREWYVSGGLLLNRPKSNPYDMANLCGYNHNAITPYLTLPYGTYPAGSAEANTYVNVGIFLNLGEINWSDLNTKCFVLSDGVEVASFLTNTIVGNSEMNIVLSMLAPGTGQTVSRNIEVWFGSTNVWQGKLTQCSGIVTLKVGVPALLGACTANNTLANRDKAALKLGLGGGETVGLVWGSATGLGVSTGGIFSGTFNVFADITDVSSGAFLRTETLCNTSVLRATLYAYKINAGVQSATYTVSTLVRLLPDQSLTYAIPAELMPLADGDVYYLYFDNLI